MALGLENKNAAPGAMTTTFEMSRFEETILGAQLREQGKLD